MDLDLWLKKQKLKKFKPDELCLYALNVIHHRHTIVYTEFQPWCTVDRKPGMRLETMEEACETRLVFLGDNLFGELLRKPVQLNIAPSNLDEIQRAWILHREHNLGEMFIEHAEATDMNMESVNVVRNITDYISPTDTTTLMSSKRTVFDVDYIPKTKVEDPDSANTNYVLNETIGSSMGEIIFPAPVVKTETPAAAIHDNVTSILAEHSPQCHL